MDWWNESDLTDQMDRPVGGSVIATELHLESDASKGRWGTGMDWHDQRDAGWISLGWKWV